MPSTPLSERARRPAAGPLPRLRAILSERSRRGRIASYLLALAVLAVAGVVLYAFFPRRPEPRVVLALPGSAGIVGPLETLHAWPAMRLRLSGYHMTDESGIDLRLAGRPLGVLSATTRGVISTSLVVPPDLRPGSYPVVATDLGSGKVAARTTLVVEDPRRPTLIAQPPKVAAGTRVALTGGGLPPRAPLRIVLDPETAEAVTVLPTATLRTGILIVTVLVPADAGRGTHRLRAVDAAGTPVAADAPFEVRE